MKIGSVIKFHDELFFDGAVQLSWLQKKPEQAAKAASAFVFHGPRYHGIDHSSASELSQGYRLKDTATFVDNLVDSLLAGSEDIDVNPYWLVVAGYGSGKSHLALTIASLLSQPQAEIAEQVLEHLVRADQEIAQDVTNKIRRLEKPVLILPLDGMANFHLGSALSRAAFQQLKLHGISSQALRDLSPRFQIAEQFVQRNYSIRIDQFIEKLPNLSENQICQQLRELDESTYSIVDSIYADANGRPIPVDGMESAQDLLDTLCRVYCAADGPFSHVLILFDEFGRYLEYAADKPNLAGDSTLQQIFQGVQDNSTKVRFVGFIQYELKAYLKRFGGSDLRQLQRYVTRFDTSEKFYLSSNLETIFAHMIGKDEEALKEIWYNNNGDNSAQMTWETMMDTLPGFNQLPLWGKQESFTQVIAKGCWPLHPLTVWFLTKLKDVVQSRSALTFIRDIVERSLDYDVNVGTRLRYISVAQLVLQNMLPELIAAEREAGGTTAEVLQYLLNKYQGHIELDQQFVLAAVAALEKMRISRKNVDQYNELLCEATGLSNDILLSCIELLSELGALEWNEDLGQYELLSDGTSRAQFQQWMRKQLESFTSDAVRDFFIRQAVTNLELSDIVTDFAQTNEINTSEWYFEASYTNSHLLIKSLEIAFEEWENGKGPKEAKGKIIYLYLHPEDSIETTAEIVNSYFSAKLKKIKIDKAPIWVIVINDSDGKLAEHMSRMHLFNHQINSVDAEKFQRFLPIEQDRSRNVLKDNIQKSIKQRVYWIAGFESVPTGRFSAVASAIFKSVYPKAIPFPFDGFATASGGGAGDVAQLIRGLITRQVNGTWVQAQPRRLQNRINSVLVESWRAFLPNGKLCVPQQSTVKAVYEYIESAHQQDQGRTLLDTYLELIRAPYGFNTSSAGLFLGLMLASETPQRRVTLDGVLVPAAEWISQAFKRSNELDQELLKQSSLVFLAEDAIDRWRNLLNRWEAEQTYEGKLLLASEAKNLAKDDPIPETLEGTYKYLIDITNQIASNLQAMDERLTSIEKNIERAEKVASIDHSIKFGVLLLNILDEIDLNVWPSSVKKQCEEFLTIIRFQIDRGVERWIPTQVCRSVALLSEFRSKADKQIRGLERLGFASASSALANQVQGSIQRVEKLQKYSLTLAESDDFPRQPLPTDSTTVRFIRDAISSGDRLIKVLNEANDALSSTEIKVRVDAIVEYQKLLQESLKQKRDSLGEIYVAPANEQELRQRLLRARQLQEVFIDTPDEEEISGAIAQIERILSDIDSWPSEKVSVERLENLLEQQVSAQVTQINSFLEDNDIDSIWSVEEVYKALADERIDRVTRLSEEWMQPRKNLFEKIEKCDLSQCKELEIELANTPAFLSSEARNTVKSLQNLLSTRVELLEEQARKEIVAQWLKKFPGLFEISTLQLHECEKHLKYISDYPCELTLQEIEQVQTMSKTLTNRIDQLSVEELFNRVKRLSDKHKMELLQLLESLDLQQ